MEEGGDTVLHQTGERAGIQTVEGGVLGNCLFTYLRSSNSNSNRIELKVS